MDKAAGSRGRAGIAAGSGKNSRPGGDPGHREIGDLIHGWFREHAEDGYRRFVSGLIPDPGVPILGVRVPVIRRLARRLIREEGAGIRWALPDLGCDRSREGRLLYGMLLGADRGIAPRALMAELGSRLDLICNWELCDSLATELGFIRDRGGEFLPLIPELLADPRPYAQRLGMVLFMMHLAGEEGAGAILEQIIRLPGDHRYVLLGKAWILSKLFCGSPLADQVGAVLEQGRLTAEEMRLTQAKIRDIRLKR